MYTLRRKLDFEPGWDKRDPDPKKNYGIHGMSMRWLIYGKLGTVQFLLYTNWQIASVRKEHNSMEMVHRFVNDPMPADLGYHSRVYMYEGQTPMQNRKITGSKKMKINPLNSESPELEMPIFTTDPVLPGCQYLNGDPCFYDGSSLQAITMFDTLVEEGEEALWTRLENYYSRNLGLELPVWRHLYIFLEVDEDIEESWFYIYRHQNGGWEKSVKFNTPWKALFSKIKTHIRVYKKKLFKFISQLLTSTRDNPILFQ